MGRITIVGAVKRHCLECSGNNKKEVDRCPVVKCALWLFRGYKKKPLKPKRKG